MKLALRALIAFLKIVRTYIKINFFLIIDLSKSKVSNKAEILFVDIDRYKQKAFDFDIFLSLLWVIEVVWARNQIKAENYR